MSRTIFTFVKSRHFTSDHFTRWSQNELQLRCSGLQIQLLSLCTTWPYPRRLEERNHELLHNHVTTL